MTTRSFTLMLLGVALLGAHGVEAQTPAADVQTVGGIRSVRFSTPQGGITVQVSADATAGDTISGVVVAEPAGATPQEQQANFGQLNGLVVELQGQSTPVSGRRYQWTIPPTQRSGSASIVLRDATGRVIAQSDVPVDPVPATAPRPAASSGAFELPIEVQRGQPAVIRGPLDGTFGSTAVTVNGMQAELLASSPRQLAFRIPAMANGPVDVRLSHNGVTASGMMRVMGVQLTATSMVMVRGQKATLTVTAIGLQNLGDPVTLTLTNLTPDAIQLQGGTTQTITIQRNQVRGDGTFVLTRGLTGLRAGGFSITSTIGRPPLSQFDVQRSLDRALTTWTANTGIAISADARGLIRQSVLDARRPLEEFLRRQQGFRADIESVFERLLSHYCFDLRDDKFLAGRGRAAAAGYGIVAAALRQPAAARVELGSEDVRRWSFAQFLSRLMARFANPQPVGYLVITSVPAQASITIDGERKSEVTNRRFVASAGDHVILVTGGTNTCRQSVTIGAYQTHLVECRF